MHEIREIPMQIYVMALDGVEHNISVQPQDSLDTLKQKVADATNVSKDQIVLRLGREVLEGNTVSESGLKDESHIKLTLKQR